VRAHTEYQIKRITLPGQTIKYRSLLLQKLGALARPPHSVLVAHFRLKYLAKPAEITSSDRVPGYASLSLNLITTTKDLYPALAYPSPSYYLFIQ